MQSEVGPIDGGDTPTSFRFRPYEKENSSTGNKIARERRLVAE